MAVYQSENGCFYSTSQECDPALCLVDGGYDPGYFGQFSKTQVGMHQHECGRNDKHTGKHVCRNQYCNHEWEQA